MNLLSEVRVVKLQIVFTVNVIVWEKLLQIHCQPVDY